MKAILDRCIFQPFSNQSNGDGAQGLTGWFSNKLTAEAAREWKMFRYINSTRGANVSAISRKTADLIFIQ